LKTDLGFSQNKDFLAKAELFEPYTNAINGVASQSKYIENKYLLPNKR
jgi:hypothetical protein